MTEEDLRKAEADLERAKKPGNILFFVCHNTIWWALSDIGQSFHTKGYCDPDDPGNKETSDEYGVPVTFEEIKEGQILEKKRRRKLKTDGNPVEPKKLDDVFIETFESAFSNPEDKQEEKTQDHSLLSDCFAKETSSSLAESLSDVSSRSEKEKDKEHPKGSISSVTSSRSGDTRRGSISSVKSSRSGDTRKISPGEGVDADDDDSPQSDLSDDDGGSPEPQKKHSPGSVSSVTSSRSEDDKADTFKEKDEAISEVSSKSQEHPKSNPKGDVSKVTSRSGDTRKESGPKGSPGEGVDADDDDSPLSDLSDDDGGSPEPQKKHSPGSISSVTSSRSGDTRKGSPGEERELPRASGSDDDSDISDLSDDDDSSSNGESLPTSEELIE